MAGMQLFLAKPKGEPVRRPHVAELRWWGPLGRSTNVVGRSHSGPNCPPASSGGLVLASSCPNSETWPVLSGFASVLGLLLVHLSLNLHSNFICDFILD